MVWSGVVWGGRVVPTVAGVETQQDWRLRAVSGYPDTQRDRLSPHILLTTYQLTDRRPVSLGRVKLITSR